MTLPVESVLPKSDRLLLRAMGHIVPSSDREDWLRCWEAELWWRRYPPSREVHTELFTDLSVGLCRDAFWLRFDSWSRVLRGTPVLCLLALAISCSLSILLAMCLYGGWYRLTSQFLPQSSHFLFASALIVIVASATADKRPDIPKSLRSTRMRLFQDAFLVTKGVSLLWLTYFLSLDVSSPIVTLFPQASEYAQMLFFVISSICGLRWAFHDQERRCKACLRLLNEPRPVGRPSHNLIEQSGNESACRKGHGFLSVPELETSWRQSSEWIGTVIS